MSFKPQLWQELGLNSWQLSPEFQASSTTSNQDSTISTEESKASLEATVSYETPSNKTEGQQATSAKIQQAQPEADTSTQQKTAAPKKLLLFGKGLQEVWKQRGNPAWELWRSILNYHLNKPEQLVFYDTLNLTDEDKIEESLEVIIEQGFEVAYSMDSEHPINEVLSDNIQLVFLPSLEEMLDQPVLKRDLFEKLTQEFPWQKK